MPFLLLFPLFFVTVTTYHFSATTLWTILWVPVVTSTEYYNKHFKSSRQKPDNKSNRNLLDIGEVFLSNIVSPINPWEYGNRLNMFLSLQHPTFFAWSWHLHLGGLTVAKILSSHPLSLCFLIWFDSHWVFGNLVGKLSSPHGAWLWRAMLRIFGRGNSHQINDADRHRPLNRDQRCGGWQLSPVHLPLFESLTCITSHAIGECRALVLLGKGEAVCDYVRSICVHNLSHFQRHFNLPSPLSFFSAHASYAIPQHSMHMPSSFKLVYRLQHLNIQSPHKPCISRMFKWLTLSRWSSGSWWIYPAPENVQKWTNFLHRWVETKWTSLMVEYS